MCMVYIKYKKERKKNVYFLLFRHAALMAISAIGEGCHKQMEALLPQIMDGVIQYLQDPVSMTDKFTDLFFRSYICNLLR